MTAKRVGDPEERVRLLTASHRLAAHRSGRARAQASLTSLESQNQLNLPRIGASLTVGLLTLQLHLPEQFPEPWIASQAVEPRIDFEIRHPVGAILVGLVEPGKGLILVFQTGVYHRDVIGRNVLLL